MSGDVLEPVQAPGREFLGDGGEVGALMRAHDWSASPLGAPETWPQALRAVVGLLLNSKFPMFVAWGEELGFLYNDAYAEILGAKHPAALGARFHDIWAEIWEDIWPLIEAAMAGRATYREDLPLTMNRHGYDEQTWFTFSYSPVRGETGAVAGMFCAVVETTSRVRDAQRQAFLFELDEVLRDLDSAPAILAVSSERLARHFGAQRAHWAWIDDAAGSFRVDQEWTAPGAPSLRGEHRLSDFGEALIDEMRRGATVSVDDVLADRLADPAAVDAAFGAELRGVLSVPLFRMDRWETALCVHTLEPRRWRADDRALVREAAERAWTRAQRAEAEARVRYSEERFRALVTATSDVVYRMSADWREMRQLDGRGFLADTESPLVAWLDEYLPEGDQPAVLAAVDEAVRTNSTFQLEHRVLRADGSIGWVFSRAIPLRDAAGEVVEWFGAASDITVRKRAEEHLRLMVNELNHRVKNTLATVQGISTQTLRAGEIPTPVREALTARLLALAAAHDVLTDEKWAGADIRELLEQTAAPYAGLDGRRPLVLEGPHLYLAPKIAIALALAFHELATNAAKYGALSAPDGQVRVAWQAEDTAQGRRLSLVWRETGGPPVTPPTRTGFGARLIQRGLSAELGGEVSLEFRPEGLVCTMQAILADREPELSWGQVEGIG